MKFGKITSANVSTDALSLGGAIAGGALSGGLMTFVPQSQETLARGGMAFVGLLGAASVKPKTSVENLVKFALLGIGIRQSAELIKGFAGKEIQLTETSTASQKFVGGMVGLACPCDAAGTTPYLASPTINFPALRSAQALRNPQAMPLVREIYQEEAPQAVKVGAF